MHFRLLRGVDRLLIWAGMGAWSGLWPPSGKGMVVETREGTEGEEDIRSVEGETEGGEARETLEKVGEREGEEEGKCKGEVSSEEEPEGTCRGFALEIPCVFFKN